MVESGPGGPGQEELAPISHENLTPRESSEIEKTAEPGLEKAVKIKRYTEEEIEAQGDYGLEYAKIRKECEDLFPSLFAAWDKGWDRPLFLSYIEFLGKYVSDTETHRKIAEHLENIWQTKAKEEEDYLKRYPHSPQAASSIIVEAAFAIGEEFRRGGGLEKAEKFYRIVDQRTRDMRERFAEVNVLDVMVLDKMIIRAKALSRMGQEKESRDLLLQVAQFLEALSHSEEKTKALPGQEEDIKDQEFHQIGVTIRGRTIFFRTDNRASSYFRPSLYPWHPPYYGILTRAATLYQELGFTDRAQKLASEAITKEHRVDWQFYNTPLAINLFICGRYQEARKYLTEMRNSEVWDRMQEGQVLTLDYQAKIARIEYQQKGEARLSLGERLKSILPQKKPKIEGSGGRKALP